MTVKEFYEYMCRRLPVEQRLDFDYDGMSCCPDPEAQIEKVMICLDVTDTVVDEAIEDGCNVILAHHPMLFGGVKEVVSENYRGEKLIKLIKNNISVMSFHTRLDGAEGGVNDTLADIIGVTVTGRFGEKGIGRIGELETPMTAQMLASLLKTSLGAPYVEYSDCGKLIKKVAICGGSFNFLIDAAIAEGVDAFIGGEASYHSLTDSPDRGISLFAAGHFYTENPVCGKLFEIVAECDLMPIITFSNRIMVE